MITRVLVVAPEAGGDVYFQTCAQAIFPVCLLLRAPLLYIAFFQRHEDLGNEVAGLRKQLDAQHRENNRLAKLVAGTVCKCTFCLLFE